MGIFSEITNGTKMYTFVALMLLAVARADERIINGEDATSTTVAPYQVSLQQSGSHFCGGTVISATHVMSAGHCKINGFLSRYTVALGGTDYRYLDQQLSMSSWVVHPQFTQSNGINYDYSVITVSSAITLTPGVVEAATLPASGQEFTGNAIISGWGKTKGTGIGSNTLPTTLQGVELASLHNPSVSEAHPPELVHATETLVAQWSKPIQTESPGLSETPHGEHHHVTPAHTQPSTPRTQLLLTGFNNNCRSILLALFLYNSKINK